MNEINGFRFDISEIDFPDWVFDKHTNRGKELNRGMYHFYIVASKLHNCFLKDQYEELAQNINCAKEKQL